MTTNNQTASLTGCTNASTVVFVESTHYNFSQESERPSGAKILHDALMNENCLTKEYTNPFMVEVLKSEVSISAMRRNNCYKSLIFPPHIPCTGIFDGFAVNTIACGGSLPFERLSTPPTLREAPISQGTLPDNGPLSKIHLLEAWNLAEIHRSYGSSKSSPEAQRFTAYFQHLRLINSIRGTSSITFHHSNITNFAHYSIRLQIGLWTGSSVRLRLDECLYELRCLFHQSFSLRKFTLMSLNEHFSRHHFDNEWSFQQEGKLFRCCLKWTDSNRTLRYNDAAPNKRDAQQKVVAAVNASSPLWFEHGSFAWDLLKLAGDVESNPGPWLGEVLQHLTFHASLSFTDCLALGGIELREINHQHCRRSTHVVNSHCCLPHKGDAYCWCESECEIRIKYGVLQINWFTYCGSYRYLFPGCFIDTTDEWKLIGVGRPLRAKDYICPACIRAIKRDLAWIRPLIDQSQACRALSAQKELGITGGIEKNPGPYDQEEMRLLRTLIRKRNEHELANVEQWCETIAAHHVCKCGIIPTSDLLLAPHRCKCAQPESNFLTKATRVLDVLMGLPLASLTKRHMNSPAHSVNSTLDELDRRSGFHRKGKKLSRREASELGAATDLLRQTRNDEAEENRMRIIKKAFKKCDPSIRMLLDHRSSLNFGATNSTADYTSPGVASYFQPLMDRYNLLHPKYFPQGRRFCVIGWEGVQRHIQCSVSIVRPAYLFNNQKFVNESPSGQHVDFILGPAPFANQLGFFFNEMWLPEHYKWLKDNGFGAIHVHGTHALYTRIGRRLQSRSAEILRNKEEEKEEESDSEEEGSEEEEDEEVATFRRKTWTTVPTRFTIEIIQKTMLFAQWWKFSGGDTIAVVVDAELPNCFTCGVELHGGSYTTAMRKIIEAGGDYMKYWPLLVQGTALFHGAAMSDLTELRWQGCAIDTDFGAFLRPFVRTSRIAEGLFQVFGQHSDVQKQRSHFLDLTVDTHPPQNPLPLEMPPAAAPETQPKQRRTIFLREVDAIVTPPVVSACQMAGEVTHSVASLGHDIAATPVQVLNTVTTNVTHIQETLSTVPSAARTAFSHQLTATQATIASAPPAIAAFASEKVATLPDPLAKIREISKPLLASLHPKRPSEAQYTKQKRDFEEALAAEHERQADSCESFVAYDMTRGAHELTEEEKKIWFDENISHSENLVSFLYGSLDKKSKEVSSAVLHHLEDDDGLKSMLTSSLNECAPGWREEHIEKRSSFIQSLRDRVAALGDTKNLKPREIYNFVAGSMALAQGLPITELDEKALMSDLYIRRSGVECLRTQEEEYDASSIRHFVTGKTEMHDYFSGQNSLFDNCEGNFHSTCPVIQQQDTFGAVTVDGGKVFRSIYDLPPPYDKKRIEPTIHFERIDYPFTRPECIYWLYTTRLYLPSPHSSTWATIMRAGKTPPTADPSSVAKLNKMVTKILDAGFLQNPGLRSEGFDSTTYVQFLETIAEMPAQKRRRRLESFLGYVHGCGKDLSRAMTFFAKSDEVTPFFDAPETKGASRCIYDAAETDFFHNQGTVVDVKHALKKPEEGEDPFHVTPTLEVEMPKTIPLKIGDFTILFTYGADTDNCQDSVWYTRAMRLTDDNVIHLIVGGDDNLTILYWRGKRIVIEGDVSACDQSMGEHWAEIFDNYLERVGVPAHLRTLFLNTYKDPAILKLFQEKYCTIKFKKTQLKTGVGHTSLANTICVSLCMIFALLRTLMDPEAVISDKYITDSIVRHCASLGVEMKIQVWIDPPIAMGTFHKRYFVPVHKFSEPLYTACPLPGTTLVKMCKVRAPMHMNKKTFLKRMRDGCLSRKSCSHHPFVRTIIDLWVENDCVPEDEFTYGAKINKSPQWLLQVGDGDPEDHYQYCFARYGVAREDYDNLEFILKNLDTSWYYNITHTRPSEVINLFWRGDC
jgi:hypothetical protein